MVERDPLRAFANLFDDEELALDIASLTPHAETLQGCESQTEIRNVTLDAMTNLLQTSLKICGVDQALATEVLVDIGVRETVGAGEFSPESFMELVEKQLMGVDTRTFGDIGWTEPQSAFVSKSAKNEFWPAKEIDELYSQLIMDSGFVDAKGKGSFADYLTQFLSQEKIQKVTSDINVHKMFRGYVAGRLMEELYVLTMSDVYNGLRGWEIALRHPQEFQHVASSMRKERTSFATLFKKSSELLQTFDFSTNAILDASNVKVRKIPLTSLISRRMTESKFPREKARLMNCLQSYGNAMQAINAGIRSGS